MRGPRWVRNGSRLGRVDPLLALSPAADGDGQPLLVPRAGQEDVEGHLAHRGMLTLFDFIACRDDITVGKPEPDVYLAALRGLGVEAADAIALEDSVPGHVAAHRAGLRVVVVPNPSTTRCDTCASTSPR